jgi:hybrid cluster-associated redox disulfide protein
MVPTSDFYLKNKKAGKRMTITRDMSISEIVQKNPETISVFQHYGMGCVGCSAARFENIEQGASVHGIDLEALLAALNKVVG